MTVDSSSDRSTTQASSGGIWMTPADMMGEIAEGTNDGLTTGTTIHKGTSRRRATLVTTGRGMIVAIRSQIGSPSPSPIDASVL